MLEETSDPHVYITDQGLISEVGYVEYWDWKYGDRWRIYGTCNLCGSCWEGAVGAIPTADCPVRPEISKMEHCVLTGEYLERNTSES